MTKQPLEEQQRWLYSKAVIQDMKQLSKLLSLRLEPEEIASRMGMKLKDLNKVLKLIGVKK
jgi:hypothetical protein